MSPAPGVIGTHIFADGAIFPLGANSSTKCAMVMWRPGNPAVSGMFKSEPVRARGVAASASSITSHLAAHSAHWNQAG
jgi:hypothetical protein